MTGHTRRRAVVAVVIAAAVAVAPAAASANPIEFFTSLFAGDVQTRAFSDHTVNTVTPQGTTINLFDYWVRERNSNDYPASGLTEEEKNEIYNSEGGINAGHVLKFSAGRGNGVNNYLAPDPHQGIVESKLDESGYPKLKIDTSYDIDSAESLDYLFNSNDEDSVNSDEQVDGKKAFTNVGGLLQVNADGYYYYDSTKNFASFNEDENSFSVYNQHAVDFYAPDSGLSENGQFFPFGQAAEVFDENGDSLVSKGVLAKSNVVNHWFGMSMTTRFVQPQGGFTDNNEPVTYSFSGDDDVWVFIDGVLVGDLGGIHSKADLSIDFSTGKVVVTGLRSANNKYIVQETTLRELFGADENATGWSGDTFADDTLHTLKFFYLERGSGDSNMSLYFNLVTVPESQVLKVDQQNNPIQNAVFELYAADENYEVSSDTSLVSGSTNNEGVFTLVDSSDTLVTFKELYENNNTNHFVLRETGAPDKYRVLTEDIHIEYSPDTGVVYCTNYWDTGAFANASEMIIAPTSMSAQDGATLRIGNESDGDLNGELIMSGGDKQLNSGGTLFALPLYRESGNAAADVATDWKGVYGTVESGWQLSENSTADYKGVAEAATAQESGATVFGLNNNGLYEAFIEDLPGNIQEYYYVLDASSKPSARYAVAFYYTEAKSLADVTAGNTVRVLDPQDGTGSSDDQFSRQFAAKFRVPDMFNRLVVQKVDQTGENTVDGATFALYRENPNTNTSDDNMLGLPKVTGEVAGSTEGSEGFEGSVLFSSDDGLWLGNGSGDNKDTFYVKELTPPTGYQANDTVIEVRVDDSGVYADAGNAADGVSVLRGVGTLSKTMAQFGTDDLDATLHDVMATLQTTNGDPVADGTTWTTSTDAADTIHLTYGKGINKVLEYGATDDAGKVAVEATEGWSKLRIQQCYNHDNPSEEPTSRKTNLLTGYFKNDPNYDLSPLFSGSIAIRVANQQVNDLEISKDVTGYKGMDPAKLQKLQDEKEFSFTLDLNIPQNVSDLDAAYKLAVKDAATGASVGDPIEVKTGEDTYIFTLKHGQKAVIEDLPVGTTYTVTETPDDNFKTTVTSNDVKATSVEESISGTLDSDADDNSTNGLTSVQTSFTNAYSPSPITIGGEVGTAINGSKEVVGEGYTWEEGHTYSFEIRRVSPVNAPLPKSSTVTVEKPDSDENSKASFCFGEMTFEAPGTYVYNVVEKTPSTQLPGINYSNAIYRVTVTVTDNVGEKKLEAATEVVQLTTNAGADSNNDGDPNTGTSIDDRICAFENTYSEDAAEFALSGTKTFQLNGGASFEATELTGKFTFVLSTDDPRAPMPGGVTERSVEVANIGPNFVFSDIAFDNNDINETYTYTVREKQPTVDGTYDGAGLDGATKNSDDKWVYQGWTYDSSECKITVSVAETNNVITVTAAYPDGKNAAEFSNSYTPAQTTQVISGAKELNGRVWLDRDQFDFVLAIDTNDPDTAAAEKDGSLKLGSATTAPVKKDTAGHAFSFDAVTFSKAGTYKFVVSEQLPINDQGDVADDNTDKLGVQKSGVTYDEHKAYVTVKVEDDKQGSLKVTSVAYDNSASTDDEAKDDTLKASFVNTYDAEGHVYISGWKNIEGRTFQTADDFSFAVTAQPATSPMPGNVVNGTYKPQGGYTQGASKHALDFGKIKFTQPDTYTYTFTETKPGDGTSQVKNGVTYDDKIHVLEIVVEDTEFNGTFSIAASLDDEPLTDSNLSSAVFDIAGLDWTNKYNATGTLAGSEHLKGTKIFTGRELTEADDNRVFTFQLIAGGANTKAAIDNGTITLPTDTTVEVTGKKLRETNGKVDFNFGDIVYNSASAAGDPYAFSIVELAHDAATNPNVNGGNTTFTNATFGEQRMDGWTYEGIHYSSNARTIFLTVKDNGQGQLVGEQLREPIGSTEWTNTYGATGVLNGETDLKVSKSLVGRDWAKDETFGFKIEKVSYKEDAKAQEKTDNATLAAMPAPADTTIPVGKDGGNFGNITFTKPGIYTYKVSEVKPDELEGGMSYSSTVYTVKVTVTDNGAGTLAAAAVYSGGATVADGTMTFENALQTKSVSKENDEQFTSGSAVKIGDVLTYTVNYRNNQDAASTVTITDSIPVGTEYVTDSASESGAYDDGAKKLTWTIKDVQPHTEGSVSFQVKVTDAAVNTTIENTATVKIGDNGPDISTNPVENPVGSLGNLTISKTVTVESDQGLNADAIKAKEFTFTVVFKDASDNNLTGEFSYADPNDATKTLTIKSGDTVTLKDGQSVTIKDLPHGTKCAVTEAAAPEFTTKVNDVDGKQATVVVSADPNDQAKAEFTNHYKASDVVLSGTAAPQVKKTLTGRDWTDSDAFELVVTKVSLDGKTGDADKAAMPDIAGVTVKSANKETLVPLGGANGVTFSKTGTYVYNVMETIPTDDNGNKVNPKDGVTYDEHVATITITVTDTDKDNNYDGSLHASVSYDNSGAKSDADRAATDAAAFTNTYDAGSITLGGDGNAKIAATKTLTGRPQTAGEFKFTVTNTLNDDEVVTGATQADAADGVAAAVVFGPITYTSKSLHGDSVATPKANTKTDNLDGTVTYTYDYKVSEVTDGLANSGVTAVLKVFNVHVKVTDNGKGDLSIEVVYPEGNLAFTNTYGATAEADLPIKGHKKLTTPEGTGWKKPDITDKYTFTITGSEGAPMPSTTSVTNGENGVLDFGSITYTMENVFGDGPAATSEDGVEQASATREKTFEYTITESLTNENDKVPGVSMDGPKTFKVTVTDNGDGTLNASVTEGANQGFEFENKYTVKEEHSSLTGEGNFTITKKLDGRAMNEGEFTFVLYDAAGNEAASGSNDANGNVEMSNVKFTKPGAYTYKLIEINESAAGGVTYDTTWYTVIATVTDNGDGTLSVAWSAKKGADGDEIALTDPIVFTNTYAAKPTNAYLAVSKKYTGAELKADQFTFQVLNKDGKVVAEAKNDAMGLVAFPAIEGLDAAGAYEYTIVEVNDGQENVTYDGSKIEVTVTVEDDGKGQLEVTSVEYLNGDTVFENTYKEPEKPVTPADPTDPSKPSKPGGGSSLPTTGESAWAPIAVAALVVGVGAIAVALRMRKRS